jgi:hypothetical protein
MRKTQLGDTPLKLHLALAAAVAAFAFAGAPATAEAGGLKHLCPLTWLHGHHYQAKAVVVKKPAKKVVKKKATKKVVKKAAKPLK